MLFMWRRRTHLPELYEWDLVEFPTEEVEYDPQEIEALIGTEKSRKRNRLDSRKDLGLITCFKLKIFRALLQRLPKKEAEDPRRLCSHKETTRLVRSKMFQLS